MRRQQRKKALPPQTTPDEDAAGFVFESSLESG
jgi:hypothetical protein